MTRTHLLLLATASLVVPASAQTLLFLDNFNTNEPDYVNLDTSAVPAGRYTGLESLLVTRSSQKPQLVKDNQLYMRGGSRIRFQTADGNWANWAALASSPAIAAGGLTVDFDLTYAFDNGANWFGWAIGFMGQSAGEPGVRVTDPETDYGVMITKSGTLTRYGNGAMIGSGLSSFVGNGPGYGRHVKIEYYFTSFADGSPVIARTSVGGQIVSYDSFTWNNNAGALYMEMENRDGDTYFDNVKVSTTTVYKIDYGSSGQTFTTSSGAGTILGNFTAESIKSADGFEDSTYTLVAGDGDTDNSKFSIDSFGNIQTGSYNFKLGAAGKTYSVRVKGVGKTSGLTTTQVFTFTPVKDDDDDLLPDDWELKYAPNLTNLSGLLSGPGPGAGTGDFDGDGHTDADEYAAGGDPTSSDLDTDKDGYTDGFELAHGSSPTDAASRPALPAGFSLVTLTDDASTGISSTTTYTHKISGGGAATINGVVFDVLDTANTPANFAWTQVGTGTNPPTPSKAAITTANLSNWSPAAGNVTGTGLQGLLSTLTYSSLGNRVSQTYELSGLTPGQTYTSKLFVRKWSDTTIRAQNITYTNGTDVLEPFHALLEDQPGTVLQNGNDNSAYYIKYTYVAKSTSLKITATVPPFADAATNGSMHLYGMTNEVSGATVVAPKNLSVVRNTTGTVTLTFTATPSTTYNVTKSADLTTFTALSTPLTVTTDASGNGTVTVPATEAAAAKGFFRIEK